MATPEPVWGHSVSPIRPVCGHGASLRVLMNPRLWLHDARMEPTWDEATHEQERPLRKGGHFFAEQRASLPN